MSDTMRVRVRDHAAEAKRWGHGRGGPVVIRVEISTKCPTCGGPRGVPRNHNAVDDGEHYSTDVWDNPCGHIDYYRNVVTEAQALSAGGAL